jgi:hypothetical protein
MTGAGTAPGGSPDQASEADPFEGPKLLLDGARENIHELELQCQAFVESCRCTPVTELDRETGDNLCKIRIVQTIPGRLRVIASNGLNNLRHSLDQAVNAAAVELGATKRDSYFPFAPDAGAIDGEIRRKCRRVPSEIIRLIKAFQPYGGGDDLLYAMSRISGPNKHQLVLKLNINVPNILVESSDRNPLIIKGPCDFVHSWDSTKQELQLARVHPGGSFHYDGKVSMPLFVSLGDSEITSGEPAPALLDTLAGKVHGIVRALEAETRRLVEARAVGGLRSA